MSVVAKVVLGGGFIGKVKRTDGASWEVTLANLLPSRALRWLEAGIKPEA
jgi:preprotein translocase subunit YajC